MKQFIQGNQDGNESDDEGDSVFSDTRVLVKDFPLTSVSISEKDMDLLRAYFLNQFERYHIKTKKALQKELEHYRKEYFELRKEHGCLQETYQAVLYQHESMLREIRHEHELELKRVQDKLHAMQLHLENSTIAKESASQTRELTELRAKQGHLVAELQDVRAQKDHLKKEYIQETKLLQKQLNDEHTLNKELMNEKNTLSFKMVQLEETNKALKFQHDVMSKDQAQIQEELNKAQNRYEEAIHRLNHETAQQKVLMTKTLKGLENDNEKQKLENARLLRVVTDTTNKYEQACNETNEMKQQWEKRHQDGMKKQTELMTKLKILSEENEKYKDQMDEEVKEHQTRMYKMEEEAQQERRRHEESYQQWGKEKKTLEEKQHRLETTLEEMQHSVSSHMQQQRHLQEKISALKGTLRQLGVIGNEVEHLKREHRRDVDSFSEMFQSFKILFEKIRSQHGVLFGTHVRQWRQLLRSHAHLQEHFEATLHTAQENKSKFKKRMEKSKDKVEQLKADLAYLKSEHSSLRQQVDLERKGLEHSKLLGHSDFHTVFS